MGSLRDIVRATLVSLTLLSAAIAQALPDETAVEEPEANESWATRSPVFPTTPLDPYFELKDRIHDRTGITWMVNYVILGQGRPGNKIDNNYGFNGQLNLIPILDLDFRKFGNAWGKGQALVYYLNVHQIAGLTTTQFGEVNGNLTPINDSDPIHFLRQAWYRHDFFDERLQIMGGKTEPVVTFTSNRFAFDDQVKFMALPLSNVAAKDRVASSPGGLMVVKPLPWISLGGSVNHLKPDDSDNEVPPELRDASYYAFANLTLDFEVPYLGRGVYRINGVFTGGQGKNASTQGVVLSFDQDLWMDWGAFFRYDDTEFQTLTSTLSRSLSFGFSHGSPFGRDADEFAIGAFQTLSQQGGDFEEWGGEAYYKLALTEWCDLTMNLQVFEAVKGDDPFVTLGGRIFMRF